MKRLRITGIAYHQQHADVSSTDVSLTDILSTDVWSTGHLVDRRFVARPFLQQTFRRKHFWLKGCFVTARSQHFGRRTFDTLTHQTH